jgi:hypothetical protein
MPYVRKGKCVYLKTTGKKVGCSSSVEKAKKYIMALHANVHESFDGYVNFILESTALGLIGTTTPNGTAYSYAYNKNTSHYDLFEGKTTLYGNKDALGGSINSAKRVNWRYNFQNRFLYIWEIEKRSAEVVNELKDFLKSKHWEIKGVKSISSLDSSPEADKIYSDAHFES